MDIDEVEDDVPRRVTRRTRSSSSPIASSSPPQSSSPPKTKRGRGRPPKTKPETQELIQMETNGIDSIDFEALKHEESFSYSANTTLDVGELPRQIERLEEHGLENDVGNSVLKNSEKEEGLSTPIPTTFLDNDEVPSKISSINSVNNHDEQTDEPDSTSAANVEHLSSLIESTNESLKRKLEGTDEVLDKFEKVEQNGIKHSEGPTATKKPLLDINIRKLIPDLEKHWETVEKDPTDFTSWTYLLQYVDQENELLAAREAYDTFLTRYPYCYGYWKKYADYEKRNGSAAECEEVFRRGLKAIPLSVDLWIHYLNYTKAARENQPGFIRCQFEAALEACGMEFRSDKLWEHYVHWEKEQSNWKNVLKIYDRVISMPTQNYQSHFQNLNDFIKEYNPIDILSEDEYTELKPLISKMSSEDEMREKVLERRAEIHKQNEEEVKSRWDYEEAIKRPYFHVKPLEKSQLKMWKEYLEFEIGKGDFKRIITLFERCLIACALYEEYWIKYAKFLQSQTPIDTESVRYVYSRGCEIHHKGKLWINLHRSAFEEQIGNSDKALEILKSIELVLPDSLHVKYRIINFERRKGNLQKCKELFQKYITSCKNSATSVHLTIKYARFLSQRMNMYENAKKLLEDTVDLDENNRAKVIMALVDLGIQRNPIDVPMIISSFNRALSGTLTGEQKITIAHRKVEFLEEYGQDISSIEAANAELQGIAKDVRDNKKEDAKKPEEEKISMPVTTATINGLSSYQSNYNASIYGLQYDQFGQYSNWSSGDGYTETHGWSAYQGYYG